MHPILIATFVVLGVLLIITLLDRRKGGPRGP